MNNGSEATLNKMRNQQISRLKFSKGMRYKGQLTEN